MILNIIYLMEHNNLNAIKLLLYTFHFIIFKAIMDFKVSQIEYFMIIIFLSWQCFLFNFNFYL